MSANWQPIESAPRDGSVVLAYWDKCQSDECRYGLVRWDVEESCWCDPDDFDDQFGPPSHWTQLPEPPQ